MPKAHINAEKNYNSKKGMDINMNIEIVHASPADAAELLDHLKLIGGETDNLTFGAEGLPFTVEMEASYLAKMENSRDSFMLVAKSDGHIIGNASLSRLPRRMSHRGDLSVAVSKAYWGHGVGTLLMESLLKIARENSFEAIDLQVRSDNKRAIRLYEKMGFEKLLDYPDYFKIDGETFDVSFMCLRLV